MTIRIMIVIVIIIYDCKASNFFEIHGFIIDLLKSVPTKCTKHYTEYDSFMLKLFLKFIFFLIFHN
jgi:hypothetical protein